MNTKEQDRFVADFRRRAIQDYNLDVIRSGKTNYMRGRRSNDNFVESPIMCSGCKGFFAKGYKSRHPLICPAAGSNIMVPIVSLDETHFFETYPKEFIELLNSLQLDEVCNYVKQDEIILMIGHRFFGGTKRKKGKIVGTAKTVRTRMRLTTRLYLSFREFYSKQSAITQTHAQGNAADMYRRESITILGEAINALSDRSDEDINHITVTGQKTGLKISIQNLLIISAYYLIRYYLVKWADDKSKRVADFLVVLKLYEDELFGDAYCDINYRRNINVRKPKVFPKQDDVNLLLDEYELIMKSIDTYDFPADNYISVRSAVAASLVIFNARRGAEPVRLQISQWIEALNGEWIEREESLHDFDPESMLITYQTSKGSDHLVSVLFPHETLQACKFLANLEIRKDAGVHKNNVYLRPCTHHSMSHASGWHCINEILKRLNRKGTINATKNRHRVASLLAKFKLSEKEKELIFKHFGHSQKINKDVYQTPPGLLQIANTGQKLLKTHKQRMTQVVIGKYNFLLFSLWLTCKFSILFTVNVLSAAS